MSTFHQAGLGPCTGGQKATGGGFQPLKTSSLAREYAIWYASGKGYAASSEVENCRPAGPCITPHGLCLCDELSPGQARFSSSKVDVLCASEVHFGRWDPYAHAWWAVKCNRPTSGWKKVVFQYKDNLGFSMQTSLLLSRQNSAAAVMK